MRQNENPKVIDYRHHNKFVSVVGEFQGTHKDICICHQGCLNFKPDWEDNCEIAEIAFQLSKLTGLVLVMECDEYRWDGQDESR